MERALRARSSREKVSRGILLKADIVKGETAEMV
jgi:hypothetical protein